MLNERLNVFIGEKRFVEDYPKVGIRPTIDGRYGGVRESLEEQTKRLAKAVAEFIENNVYLPNGEKVKCVLPQMCIGAVVEARMADELFKKEGVGVSITVTPCWCYGTETMDMTLDIPKAVWGFNGTERPGAVYLAAVSAAHNQKGIPVFKIYGKDVQDRDDFSIPQDVQEKILKFVKSALAVSIMKNKSYLSIGSVSMGIAGSIVDPDFFEDYLGMRVEYVDMSEIIRRIEEKIYDQEEFERAIQWVRNNCKEGEDPNPPEKRVDRKKKDEVWEFVVKMAIITRDLMISNKKLEALGYPEEALGHNAILAGFQGQRHWTDHFPNGDFMETILNSSFDWNGLRQPYILATENDSLNGVCMLFGHLLTNTAQIFADVRTYWSPDAIYRVTGWKPEGLAQNGVIHLINSGSAALDGTGQQEIDGKPAIKPFWEITEQEVKKCLDATRFCYANLGYFRGGGFSTKFVTRGGMPVTISRLNIVKGLGPVLQIAEGWTVELSANVHEILDRRTDPTWPTTWFVPKLTGKGAFKSVYSVMENWGANHCAITYGHVGDLFITLASMLRIPVCMHNVEEERIFRPSAWSAFGTEDLEGADFRACKNFGPLYKK
ncbi:L-fucose isomerase [Caldicellulosiruptor bescii]|uniref:L-fucose isomerase n=2 Tax=Caldicellulosiruptor bescii TaxID=31899 RepID=B9MLG0_CALBD|nr:L-fucose isomerase [Caldicellulosiruptor bescii]ACM61150.1 L-fucose isomerase [Caldicellulosiruptor bescii DSM 6725]PBC89037.1 L-fucose isomerase [Caldicellulosiruptor bescii]PBC91481.1 L-fucose isomerase [Caldicellulosiruptor bescii]PBD03107.1 L-fucose isomerase [Caldicellulosiruptor bescii]PBD07279.1 L-fucose isomerase [Caldicellulosiruptor bescii]